MAFALTGTRIFDGDNIHAGLAVIVEGSRIADVIASSRITWVPFAVALVSCVAVGLVFGIHPARKAARVDPAASLRGRAA